MADDSWSSWQAEQAGTSSSPSIGSILLGFAIVAVLLLALLGSAGATTAGGGRDAGQPACAELARLQRHGATGPSVQRAARACQRASSGR
jgi:hypothetical protein